MLRKNKKKLVITKKKKNCIYRLLWTYNKSFYRVIQNCTRNAPPGIVLRVYGRHQYTSYSIIGHEMGESKKVFYLRLRLKPRAGSVGRQFSFLTQFQTNKSQNFLRCFNLMYKNQIFATQIFFFICFQNYIRCLAALYNKIQKQKIQSPCDNILPVVVDEPCSRFIVSCKNK